MEGNIEYRDDNGRRIRVSLQDAAAIDGITYSASSMYSKSRRRSDAFPVTIRYYMDHLLADHVYRVTSAIDHPSVVKPQHLLNPGSGQAKIVFDPFYRYSFREWLQTSPNNDQIRHTFRSVVAGIDLLYRHHHFGIGFADLEDCIRVDDNHNAQIVLHSRGADDMETGVFEDMTAFNRLVVRVFQNRRSFNTGLGMFELLYALLCANRQTGLLRSLSYYLFHNALFYEINDRIDFMSKLLMFRYIDKTEFDNNFFTSPHLMSFPGVWWTNPNIGKVNSYIVDLCNERFSDHDNKPNTFLLCYERCISHHQRSNFGVLELQKIIDVSYPNAIYRYYYCFVERIAVNMTFKGHEVLEYMMNLAPNSGFLRRAS